MLKRNNLFLLLIILIAAIFFSGCGSDTPKPKRVFVPIKKIKKKNFSDKTILPSEKISKFKFTLNADSRDPFKSFFNEKQLQMEEVIEEHIPKTPLMMYSIAQFKLVAIIMSKHKPPVAMVQTEDNKGLFFQVGDYIGTELYKVAAIKQDKVILEKKVKDLLNNIKVIKKVLTIEMED